MNQAERIKTLLEREIVSGRLKQGEKIDESEIASVHSVSRTPVREALMKLEAIGLVERRRRHGSIVKGITLKRLVQMLEVLSGLEGFAGSLAARRIKKAERIALTKAYKNMEKAAEIGNPDDYYDANIHFHRVIYSASYNDALIEQLNYFGERLEPFIREQHHKPGWIKKTMTDHKGIYEAIIGGSSEGAGELMRKHLHFDGEQFIDFATLLD